MRIISDGTIQGTSVLDDAGNVVQGVVYIKWEANANSPEIGTVTMQVVRVPIELSGLVVDEKVVTLGREHTLLRSELDT